MAITKTPFQGLLVFEPTVYEDERGYFLESFNQKLWEAAGIDTTFVQDNESMSGYGTLRGMHYQLEPMAQTKLIRVIRGKILDVVVDLREESVQFGQHYAIRLSAKNKKQLYIPKGFAHGFICRSKRAIVSYKCDNYYSPSHEAGIHPLDETLNINWGFDRKDMLISEKDLSSPSWLKRLK